MRNWLILASTLTVAILALLAVGRADSTPPLQNTQVKGSSEPHASASPTKRAPARGRDEFVGSAVCAPCHQAQSRAYFGSHHAKALTTPSSAAAERFAGQKFSSELGGTTRFSLRDGAPVVSTPVAGGAIATFPISYVVGVWPLDQYVVATERGKLQSLGVAWDSRAANAGGGRLFHVYGHAGVAPNDTLFFTAPAQNFNHVCADCHSTRLERRYDSAADSFDTRWAEPAVGCEACHGPGAEHVRSAEAARGNESARPTPFALNLKPSEPWLPSASGSPTPRAPDSVEVEVCAPCHSRRTPIQEGFLASDAFLDSFEPDLLRPTRYHVDGQVRGEVFEWGSFLQSRMYAAGVGCSDCHDAHSGKVLAQGNALCVRCHDASRFDAPTHSHHGGKPDRSGGRAGGKLPLCVDCHMPPTTFMQVDERRDHSIRIPRPDHSVEYGTPNACNGCHTDQPATWARDWLAKWTPTSSRRPHFVDALAKDRSGALDAPRALRSLAVDPRAPSIARATALERLGSYPSEPTRQALQSALASSDALVVYGAVRGAAQLSAQQRLPLLVPILEHPVRAVRVAAGKALAGSESAHLSPRARGALDRALAEVVKSFDVSASQPQAHVERSAFELARGHLAAAEASLDAALRREPCLAEAHLNLAELERERGDERAAERAIRAALACNPQYAAAHHALGLWLVRARRFEAAIASLKTASDLVPAEVRFSYVLSVALASSGDRAAAIRTLETTLERRPNDHDSLRALAGYLHQAGKLERESEVRRKLDILLQQ